MDNRMVRYFDKKKYMWDGYVYKTKEEVSKREDEYLQRGFEVKRVSEDSEFLLYTRRVVKEVIVTNK